MNLGVSSQKSNSSSAVGLRGTQYQPEAEANTASEGRNLSDLSSKLMATPNAMMDYGKLMMPSGKYGLGENADQGVQALGDYQFGKASANSATKGQVTPENMSNVIGSSMQNMLPFLIPQLQAHQYAQFAAPQSLMQTAKTSADYWLRALGAQSDSSGTGNSFGFGVVSNSAGGGKSSSES